MSDPYGRAFVPDILSLGIFLLRWLWPEFDIDHASHVSYDVPMASMRRPEVCAYVLSSFAIWDKSKVIMAISAAIWVINLGFQLIGELASSTIIPCETQRIRFVRYR